MKKIVFSIIALSSLALSSKAQLSAHVEQGTSGDNTQQGNFVNIKQNTSVANYSINAYSPFSTANVAQTLDASAVGNSINSYQFGSANYNTQTQAGSYNTISLTQWNQVLGLIGGNGSVAYLNQGGSQNIQSVFQHTQSTVNNDGGNLLITNQNSSSSEINVTQISNGAGNFASVTQSEGVTTGTIDLTQNGSDNIATLHQVNGDLNVIHITQTNDDAAKAGNTIDAAQYGGDSNILLIGQAGSNNKVSTVQDGNSNFSILAQEGDGNTAKVFQLGESNGSFIQQTGNGNTVTATQSVGNVGLTSSQIGSGNTATITQTGFIVPAI